MKIPKYFDLVSGIVFVALVGASKPASAQNTDYLRVTFNSIDVHTLLEPDRPGKRSAELYAKVRFPQHDWLRSSRENGNAIRPGWRFSRNVQVSNHHSIDIEVWDHDRRGSDDRGLNISVIDLNISNCSYSTAVNELSGKVIYYGQPTNNGGCLIREQFRGSHVTADVTIEAY